MTRFEAIRDLVCEEFGVTACEMSGPIKVRAVAEPRMVAYAFCRKYGGPYASLSAIAVFFGGRDHTTIRSGLLRFESHLRANPRTAAPIQAIEDRIDAMRFYRGGQPIFKSTRTTA